MARTPNIPQRKHPRVKQAQPQSQAVAQLFNQGVSLHQQEKLEQAKIIYEQVLAQQPRHCDALHLLGVLAFQANDHALAAELIKKAIDINPTSATAYASLGLVLQGLGRLDEALVSYDKALALKPGDAEAFNNRGNVLNNLRRLDEALVSYDKALALKPDYAEAFYNRGVALNALRRLDEALVSYDKALALKPDYAEAFYNRGAALNDLRRLDEALVSYNKALALKPDYAEAFNNRGNVLNDLRRLDEALVSYDKALALKPDFAEAFNNCGTALRELRRLDEALGSYDKALSLEPDFAEAFNNRGTALRELRRLDEALACYDKALALEPDYAEAFNNRGNVLSDLKRLDEALVSYDKALDLKPDYEFLSGKKLNLQMHLCDWSDLTAQLDQLESALRQDSKVTYPFELLGLTDNPELQLLASKIWVESRPPASDVLGDFIQRVPDGKIRIGYYSADFHNHATSYLMAELFEAHDDQRFELYGFSYGPDRQDEMRKRVSDGLGQFIDVTQKSDREVAKISRDMGIDIAIDLKGFTKDSRTGVFAERCAPIQVSYLGYPGTTGAHYIDYIVADKTVIPQESQQFYSEKIVYLPHSYQVNDSKRKISDKVFTRHELGLPESGFVFCCFNNNFKILPETFDGWMRLLQTVEGSVLWLLADNPTAVRNLQKEAQNRGVDPHRLVFAPRMPLDEHLARHRLADLFIDTFPCNAHTTASDALWAGLPVLTRTGQSFASRVAASLLNAIGLPELITEDQMQYEHRALSLAQDPVLLAEIKTKLVQSRSKSPLFNAQLFAKNLEAAYEEIYRRSLEAETPNHIDVSALV